MQKLIAAISGLILIALGAYLIVHYKRPAGSGADQAATTSTWPDYRGKTSQTLVYTHTDPAFEVTYPRGFSVREPYLYQELGPGKDIPGVAFGIPQKMAEGTNLSEDSYISIEWKPGTTCSMTAFLDNPATSTRISDAGFTWEVASTTGAAAGNRYEETVFLKGCTAVRYFIHFGVIENYPEGSVREFDRAALIASFDGIRRSFVLRAQ
jgi:hypothetical protein